MPTETPDNHQSPQEKLQAELLEAVNNLLRAFTHPDGLLDALQESFEYEEAAAIGQSFERYAQLIKVIAKEFIIRQFRERNIRPEFTRAGMTFDHRLVEKGADIGALIEVEAEFRGNPVNVVINVYGDYRAVVTQDVQDGKPGGYLHTDRTELIMTEPTNIGIQVILDDITEMKMWLKLSPRGSNTIHVTSLIFNENYSTQIMDRDLKIESFLVDYSLGKSGVDLRKVISRLIELKNQFRSSHGLDIS